MRLSMSSIFTIIHVLLVSLTSNSQSDNQIQLSRPNRNAWLNIKTNGISIEIEGSDIKSIQYQVLDARKNRLKSRQIFSFTENNNRVSIVQNSNQSKAVAIKVKVPKTTNLHLISDSKDIIVKNLNANVLAVSKTGAIAVINLKGNADIKCQNCSIKVNQLSGAVFSVNESGNTYISFAEMIPFNNSTEHPAIITNESGELRLVLPFAAAAAIKITSKKENIISDFKLTLLKREAHKRINGVSHFLYGINGGFDPRTMLIIRNYNGKIILEKK